MEATNAWVDQEGKPRFDRDSQGNIIIQSFTCLVNDESYHEFNTLLKIWDEKPEISLSLNQGIKREINDWITSKELGCHQNLMFFLVCLINRKCYQLQQVDKELKDQGFQHDLNRTQKTAQDLINVIARYRDNNLNNRENPLLSISFKFDDETITISNLQILSDLMESIMSSYINTKKDWQEAILSFYKNWKLGNSLPSFQNDLIHACNTFLNNTFPNKRPAEKHRIIGELFELAEHSLGQDSHKIVRHRLLRNINRLDVNG